MTYRLHVSFRFEPDWKEKTDAIEKIVGKQRSGSGAGFGQRDMDFDFDNEKDAVDASIKIGDAYPGIELEIELDEED